MKDNSGFTNWETERMYNLALHRIKRLPHSYEIFVQSLRPFESEIGREGFKFFPLYLPDPVNYWEVYGRICSRVIQYFVFSGRVGRFPEMKELT